MNMKPTLRFEACQPWAATRRRKGAGLFAARTVVALVLLCSVLLAAWPAHAQRAFEPRFSATAPGDIALIGNITMSCNPNQTGCEASRAETSPGGNNTHSNNDFQMRHLKVENDASVFSSSSATLSMPAGATVLYAGLYWSGALNEGQLDTDARRVKLRAPGATSYTVHTAEQFDKLEIGSHDEYQGFRNVTSIVATAGNGVYTVADVHAFNFDSNVWAGWSLVVVYRDPSQPLRNLSLFDGWQYANSGTAPLNVEVHGFTTPLSGQVTSRLGVLVWDGDRDEPENVGLQFGPDDANLSDVFNTANPTSNFWNSTISRDGVMVTSGMAPAYSNTLGMDLDVMSPNVPLSNGATSALARLRGTSNENVFIGMVSLVNDVYLPVLVDRIKTSTVVDPSGELHPGGELVYTVGARNTGSDDASNTVLTDEIPVGTSYVPGSLEILLGANAGAKSDAPGDDQAEFDAANNRVVFRVGAGATATQGGSLGQNDEFRIQFSVRVDDATAVGAIINNQARYDYFGEQMGVDMDDLSDADATLDGNQPTIDEVVGFDADLAITKSASVPSVGNGGSVEYTIVVTNNGPDPGDNAVVTDPVVPGIDCTAATLSCEAAAGAACPASPTVAQLQGAGLTIPTLPDGGQVTLRMTCTLSVPPIP